MQVEAAITGATLVLTLPDPAPEEQEPGPAPEPCGECVTPAELDDAVAGASAAEQARADATYARVGASRVLGRHEYAPAAAETITLTSTTPVALSPRNLTVDFTAPTSGCVRVTADVYVLTWQNAANEYVGLALGLPGAADPLPGSRRLMLRRGPVITTTIGGVSYAGQGMGSEARVRYEHTITGLVPGVTYTVALLGYSHTGAEVKIISGGAFGPTVLTVHEASTAVRNPMGVVASPVGVTTTVISDGRYNSFPGVVRCPNGDLLAAYRVAGSHTAGGPHASIRLVRSTDGGQSWGAPVVLLGDTTYDYGTATLSVIDQDRIALVTWLRPNAGNPPYPDGVRILISDDDGATWSAPITVDTGDWLGKYSVSESALIYHDGAYCLGVWGEDAGAPAGSYECGILRSTDLATWDRVAHWTTGSTQGYNEVGIGLVDGTLVAVVREESTQLHHASTSTDGLEWSPLRPVRAGGHGAPKLGPWDLAGRTFVPLRFGHSGGGYLAAVAADGSITNVAALDGAAWFVYGQAVPLAEDTVGVLYALDHAGGDARLYWSTYTITGGA